MKVPNDNSIAPALAELERAGTELWVGGVHDPGFGRKLTDPNHVAMTPVITIQSRGKRSTDGWYHPRTWHNQSAAALQVLAGNANPNIPKVGEVCIAAESLNGSDIQILTNLTHQLVHHANELTGTRDQSRDDYHNRHFSVLALTVGIKSELVENKGYAKLTATPKLKKTLKDVQLDMSAFDLFRTGEPPSKAKNKLMKWTCGCTISRNAVFLISMCHRCGHPFRYDDADKLVRTSLDLNLTAIRQHHKDLPAGEEKARLATWLIAIDKEGGIRR